MSDNAKRSERMRRVANLALNDERDAARQLAAARQRIDATREQLDELEDYRRDYTGLVNNAAQRGASSMESLRNHRQFLTRLSGAIEQQSEHLRKTEGEYARRHAAWRNEHARLKALNKVVDQHRATEARVADRREAREQDEKAQHSRSRWTIDS